MIKHVFIGFLASLNEIDAARYYYRYHSKEVPRFFGPWLRRYETYKAYPPPAEAARYGAVAGFYTELWYDKVEDFIEAKPNSRPYTPPPGGWAGAVGPVTIVPAMPTEDFLGKEPAPEDKHILRWVRMLRFPRGVSPQDGENWYLGTYTQQVKQQPGLLRYAGWKVLDKPPFPTPWHRIEELWYEDFGAWQKANISSPPAYTAPPWRNDEPFVDMGSCFVKYKPDVDFLKDSPLIP